MHHRSFIALAVAFTLLTSRAAQFKIGAHQFTLPEGFEIELVAGTDLVPRPIEADFDEQGRLYVTDSSGSNDKPDKQLVEKPHRVLRLEDTNGDGKFDKTVVFADHMMFPEGCLWHDGSLYVAAPPSIWKLTDTNNDGVADVRVEWFKGKTLTGCANDLHGPYLGPDGWIYWCKGAFAKQTYTLANGKEFTTRASHIFRARPDGTGIEPVMTGGMDNPVGLAWSADGELFLSGTFFQHPAGGKRDGIIHVLYGGVYGKDHDVLDGHPRTGELLPMMTHLGPAAPVGMVRYESDVFGSEFEGNLFVCNFNLHKITCHVFAAKGATFETRDSDFLVSDNTDFHPTDVLEDADGSLLVVDTGGWYKLCCPTSQLYKPDVLGAIYRVRKTGVKKIDDPRGMKINWARATPEEWINLLSDPRPRVAARAISCLSNADERTVNLLATPNRFISAAGIRNSRWALARNSSPAATKALIELSKRSGNNAAWRIALHAFGVKRDLSALEWCKGMLGAFPETARKAAEALGRMGDPSAVPSLLSQIEHVSGRLSASEMTARAEAQQSNPDVAWPGWRDSDRALEHAVIQALIEIGDAPATRRGLDGKHPHMYRGALIALDQMPGGDLKSEEVLPLLSSTNSSLKETAEWIVERHTEWGDALPKFFAPQLRTLTLEQRREIESRLDRFARNKAIQDLMVNTLSTGNDVARAVALHVLARSGVKQMPSSWVRPVLTTLTVGSRSNAASAVALLRAVPAAKSDAEDVNAALLATAERDDLPVAARVSAAAAVGGGIQQLSEPLFSMLVSTVLNGATVGERSDAALALSRAKLSNVRQLELAAHLKRVGPMELPKLLPAFARVTNETVGMKLMDSLAASKAAQALRAETLKPAITNFPASVQQRADALLASMNSDAAAQNKRIDEMLEIVKGGDVRRGQAIFNSSKAACAACHTIGYVGGNAGPDLTRIGQIRSERDLLEAVVYPSASFVRSYEPMIVSTKSGDEFSGTLKKDSPEEIVLVTGPNAEQRIARNDVADMRPGGVSVMPSGLADQLTKGELADLVAFLKATRW